MDRLDQILGTATPLLRRAEEVLDVAGAPAGHALWDHLRRVRLMPADAAQAVAELRPPALAEASAALRDGARVCADTAASLPPPGDWEGEAAEAYEDRRRRAAAHLSGGSHSLDERLEASADLAAALHDWMIRARDNVATALADVLSSAEAVVLTASAADLPSYEESQAAADLSAHVLRVIATDYAEAEELLHGSDDLATPVPL